MNSEFVSRITAEFPVGYNTHVMCELYKSCIVFMPGIFLREHGETFLAIDQKAQRSYRFDVFPEFARVHNGRTWNLIELRALLCMTWLTTKVQ